MKKILTSLLVTVAVMTGLLLSPKHVHAYTFSCPECGAAVNIGDWQAVCYDSINVEVGCPNGHFHTYTLPQIPHNYIDSDSPDASAPTCTQTGLKYQKCTICDEGRYVEEPALGHHFETTPALQHVDATCTSAGYEEQQCTFPDCDASRRVEFKALGHSYKETVTKEATCTSDGSKELKCQRCGDTKTETIVAYGHNYSEKVIKKATCTETGLTRKTCSRCNDVQEVKVKALGHKYSDWKVKSEPTCEEKGLETRICSRCKDEEKRDIDALGHKSSEMTLKKEATCTEDGYKSSECEACGKEFRETIPATGHDFPELEVSVEPSLGKEGLKEATCKHCEEVKTEVIPALTVGEFVELHTGAVAGGAVGVAGAAGAGIYLALAKKKAAEASIAAASAAGLGVGGKIAAAKTAKKLLDSLETKVIDVVASEGEGSKSLISTFAKQPMLEVNYDGLENIADQVDENGPDMVIFEVLEDSDLVKITDLINEIGDDEIRYAAVGKKEVMAHNADTLKVMKEDKKLVSYTSYEKTGGIIADIILPLYKPEMNVENSLNGASLALSALGLDWAAGIVDMLSAGNEIKEIIEDGDPEAEDKLTILADVCSIFGLDAGDTFESIASYIENIKHAGKKTKENFGAEDPDKKTFEDLNEESEIESDENTEE